MRSAVAFGKVQFVKLRYWQSAAHSAFQPKGFSAGSRWLSEATMQQALSECRCPGTLAAYENSHGTWNVPATFVAEVRLSPLPGHYRDYFNDPVPARRDATTGYALRTFQVQDNSVKSQISPVLCEPFRIAH